MTREFWRRAFAAIDASVIRNVRAERAAEQRERTAWERDQQRGEIERHLAAREAVVSAIARHGVYWGPEDE